jgi:RND family efflux transporter MFP subunit
MSSKIHRGRPTAALAALCSLALAAACEGGRGGDAAQAPPPPASTRLAPENVAVVAEQTLVTGPELSGTLRARREASIRAEVSGTVLEVLAEAGERVKPGQALARVDDAALQDTLLAARSGVSAAKNGLQVAESNARRARTLADAGALAAQQAEQAEAGLEAARAQLADAQARLAVAGQQAGKTRVRAPFAGVVSERQVSAGDVVAPGAPLFTVIDPARLQFEAAVPAARVAAVRRGAQVDFTVTGFEEVFQGEIERVNPSVDAATGQVRVYVDVKNEGGRLISGVYAEGRVATERGAAPAAPVSAVDTTTTPATVTRVRGGRAEKVAVELGLRDELTGLVGFRAGVAPGDVLVLGSARAGLADGAAVELPARAEGQAETDVEPPARDAQAAQRPPAPKPN